MLAPTLSQSFAGQTQAPAGARSSLVCPTLASLTAPNQYRRRDLGCLSRRPTEASRWNRAPATAYSINNSGADRRKTVATSEKTRAGGGAAWIERGKHTTHAHTHTQTKLLPTPRRPSAPYSDCTKGVLQGLHRRAARTGMSQLTAAIRLAFPSSCATRNTAAPHFPSAPQKHTRTNALLARWGACARHWAIATFSRKTATKGTKGEKKETHEINPSEKTVDKRRAVTAIHRLLKGECCKLASL